jgi:Ras-related protein Rab-1A
MSNSDDEENAIEQDFDEKIKLMILGDSSVGKSSILRKYCKNEFLDKYITTIGIDFQIKNLTINNKKIKLQVWDTAGQERYRVVTKNYFNTSDGFIIIYDITNRETFTNINNWIEQITTIVGNNVKCVIFGNKNDLNNKRKVETDEGKELAEKFNFKFFETSAKEGNNIEEGFKSITMDILDDISSVKERRNNTSILKTKRGKKLNNNKEDNKKSCC